MNGVSLYINAYMEYFTLNNYIGTDPSDKETIL